MDRDIREKDNLYAYAVSHCKEREELLLDFESCKNAESLWHEGTHYDIMDYNIDTAQDIRKVFEKIWGAKYSTEIEDILLVAAMKNRIDRPSLLGYEENGIVNKEELLPDYIYVF